MGVKFPRKGDTLHLSGSFPCSRRERHAKTMDIAQEEVLTCLGIYLCERLHRIKLKLRAEEQTWQILFCIGVDALRKNFEVRLSVSEAILTVRSNLCVCLLDLEALR